MNIDNIFDKYLINEVKLKIGDIVKLIPDESKNDDKFFRKYDGKYGTITKINPVAGYKGYEVSVFNDKTITIDDNEVRLITGNEKIRVLKKYD